MSEPPTGANESNSITIEIKNEVKSMDGVDNPAFENDTQTSNGIRMPMLPPSNGGESRLLNYSNCERKLKDDLDYKSTEEMAEAVNLELMNMSCNLSSAFNGTNGQLNGFNGLNGINGIPVKSTNSTVINMAANPYGEYFIPVNEHRKYMRGEKLYVTKSKTDIENSKNKCCVWLAGLVTAMIAICLAILIATKLNQDPSTIANNERRFGGGNVMNAGVGGNFATEPGASSDNRAESTRSYLEHALEGEFTLDNIDFSPALADHESKEFKEVATSIESQLENALFDKSTLVDGDANIHIRVINLTPEKVIQYRVGWTFKSGVHNPLDPITVDAMRDRLRSSINATNGFLYNYRVPLFKIYSKRMIDDCSLNNGNCSHICSFDYETQLDFYCHCPESMKIDQTTYNCKILDDTESEGVNSEPEVSPEPTTNPGPKPSPASESDPLPEPTSDSGPKFEPEPISEQSSVLEPEPESEPEPAPEPKSEPQSNVQPEPKTEPKPELKSELIALLGPTSEQPQTEFKTVAAPTLSSEPNPEPEPTTGLQTNFKPDSALAEEPESKSEPKSESEPSSPAPEVKSEPVLTSSAPEITLEPEVTSAPEPKSEPGPFSGVEVISEPDESTSVSEPKSEPELTAAPEVKSQPIITSASEPKSEAEPTSVPEPTKSELETAPVQKVKSSPLGEQTTTSVPMPPSTGHGSTTQNRSTTLSSDEHPRSSKTLDADAATISDEKIDHEARRYSKTEVSDVPQMMGEGFTPAFPELELEPETEPTGTTIVKIAEDPVNGLELSSSSVSTSSNDIENVEGKVIPDEGALDASITDTSETSNVSDIVGMFLGPVKTDVVNVSVVLARDNAKNNETELNDVGNTKNVANTMLKKNNENTIDVSEPSQQFNELIPSPDEDTTNKGVEKLHHFAKETSAESINEGLVPESDTTPSSVSVIEIATSFNLPSHSILNSSQHLSDSAAMNSSQPSEQSPVTTQPNNVHQDEADPPTTTQIKRETSTNPIRPSINSMSPSEGGAAMKKLRSARSRTPLSDLVRSIATNLQLNPSHTFGK